jgi:hypothetical protein
LFIVKSNTNSVGLHFIERDEGFGEDMAHRRQLLFSALYFAAAGLVLAAIAAGLTLGVSRISKNESQFYIDSADAANKAVEESKNVASQEGTIALAEGALITGTQAEIAVLSDEEHQNVRTVAFYLSQGLVGSALICGVIGTILGIASLEPTGARASLEASHDALAQILSGIQGSAARILQTAESREQSVREMEQRLKELQALVSLNEEQANAVSNRIGKGTKLGITLGILSIVVTIGIGIWQVAIK